MKARRVTTLALILALMLPSMLFGFGQRERMAPQISDIEEQTRYISPESSPGVQDRLVVTPALSADEKLVVQRYRFVIRDSGGEEVYSVEEALEDPGFFRRTWRSIFWKRKEAVEVPDELVWEGVDNGGASVAEGEYTYQLVAWDDKENRGETEELPIVVDNTPPEATVSSPYLIFSPNNDGNQDIMVFEQSGSAEHEWIGRVLTPDDSEVIGYSWESGAPENLVWEGINEAGERVPDGDYRYVLSATDRAGNEFTATVDGIVVDTRDTPLALDVDRTFFSPNGDGSADTLTFLPDLPISEGIVNWSFTVRDEAGRERFTYEDTGVPPDSYAYNGVLNNRTFLREGTYEAVLEVLYENGNNPQAVSPSFVVDVTTPRATVTLQDTIFSPNGDGNKETITISQEGSEEQIWEGVIETTEGEGVRNFQWRGAPDAELSWNGRSNEGDVVADGEYRYTLSSTDRAGNRVEMESDLFEKDSRVTPILLTAGTGAFSPNGDSVKENVEFSPEIESPRGLETINYRVIGSDDETVFETTREGAPWAFSWDGSTDEGEVAPDGRYIVELVGEYRNGNRPRTTAGPITLDTVYPSASISAEYTIFSPDGDGNLDTLPIEVSEATGEERWSARILDDEGETVLSTSWSGRPEELVWDGRDEAGNRVPDGEYRYVLSSSDAAGNSATFEIETIRIDTRPTPIRVTIDRSAFSPNGDGVAESQGIRIIPEVTELIVEWSLTITVAGDGARRTFSGSAPIPETITFEGTDDEGDALPDGTYVAEAMIRYANGNEPTASSPEFDLDTVAPEVSASAELDLFSPNGDGRQDELTIAQRGLGGVRWEGVVKGAEDETVRTVVWEGDPPAEFSWDGSDDEGSPVSTGSYTYTLTGTDAAGNSATSAPVRFTKDARPRRLFLARIEEAFSPNGDGTRDTARLTTQVEPTEDAQVLSYVLGVEDSDGNLVYRETGDGRVPETVSWDGSVTEGRESAEVASDGDYTALMEATFANGDVVTGRSGRITLDTVAPQIEIEAPYLLFSPNGDGRKDVFRVTHESSVEDRWVAMVTGPDGDEIAGEEWRREAGEFVWDGTDPLGNVVDDGSYSYTVVARDRAGNVGARRLRDVRVDNSVVSAVTSFSAGGISPNGDEYRDDLRINLFANPNREIADWSLSLVDERGRTARRFAGSGAVPRSVTWEGNRDNGSSAAEGEYAGRLEVEYLKGDLVIATTGNRALLDRSVPPVAVEAGPLPFSPDDDGVNDTLNIRIDAPEDPAGYESWQVDIIDPRGSVFYTFSGRGEPRRRLTWDGRSAEGELVQAASEYTIRATFTDELRNGRTVRRNLPTDVLVIREGDQLRIRISSITFAPNSPAYTGISEEQDQQNLQTLDRLAVILQKFEEYRIRVEGHANNVTGTQREEEEELEPLSEARAEAIKSALVDRGIRASRMETVGMGGTEPVVPREDRENWWKNRRVEFILIRNN